jgi:integrase/recombinase XerD
MKDEGRKKNDNLVEAYLESLAVKGRSPLTLKSVRWCLGLWQRYAREGLFTRAHIEDYARFVYAYRTRAGKALAGSSIRKRLSTLREYLHFLYETGRTVSDYSLLIELPRRREKSLPRHIPSEQAIALMGERACLRDRAMIELLYGSGLRSGEARSLRFADVDLAQRRVYLRNPKNKQDRIVPLTARAVAAIRDYLQKERPLSKSSEDVLFVTNQGNPCAAHVITSFISHLRRKDTKITAHGLRHACAVGMLKNGADIRSIQELLGHRSLSSTQIYTRLTIEDLKKAHARYHPRRHPRVSACGRRKHPCQVR